MCVFWMSPLVVAVAKPQNGVLVSGEWTKRVAVGGSNGTRGKVGEGSSRDV